MNKNEPLLSLIERIRSEKMQKDSIRDRSAKRYSEISFPWKWKIIKDT